MARAEIQRSRAGVSRKETIRKLLVSIEKKLENGTTKPTLADFIRLTQLERELEEEERPREIIITWIDPKENESTGT